MKYIKSALLWLLLLALLVLCAAGVIKLFTLIANTDANDMWNVSFKAGFAAWLLLIVVDIIKRIKARKEKR